MRYAIMAFVLMFGELNQSFLIKKAFEVSYAIFRIGSQIKQVVFKNELEGWVIKILSSVIVENYKKAQKSIKVVECLLKLGTEVGLVGPNNAQVIINEAKVLDSAIAEFAEKAKIVSEIDLAEVFSENSQKEETSRENKKATLPNDDFSSPVSNSSLKAAMRQSAILERIRQNDNCRLKEIQELLPDVSERTLRYDLQSLMEQDLIERVGNGGPSTYYRLKTSKSQLSQREENEKNVEIGSELESKKSLLYLN